MSVVFTLTLLLSVALGEVVQLNPFNFNDVVYSSKVCTGKLGGHQLTMMVEGGFRQVLRTGLRVLSPNGTCLEEPCRQHGRARHDR